MSLPLERRLELLEKDLKESETYSRVRCFQGSAIQLFDIIKKSGLEGLVLKNRKGRYMTRNRPCEPGVKGTRSWDVQKVINYDIAHDIRITGYSKVNNQWTIDKVDGDNITPLGSLELGVTTQHRKMVWPKLQGLIINETKQFVHVEPIIGCSIKHRGFYKSGLMRVPVLEKRSGITR